MAANSKIEWTNATWNPWWGCVKVSPACDNCYAETFARRVGFSESGSQFPIWGKGTRRRFFGAKHWEEPHKWNRSAGKSGRRWRVFCASMADVLEDHPDVSPYRARLFDLIEETPNLDWLLLTKRPQNFNRFLPKAWLDHPRPHVWGGATVESTDYLWRVKELEKTPLAVRFVSYEPMLGPVDFPPTLDWIIAGAESGHRARPFNEELVRSVKNQCVATGTAFFYKQGRNGKQIISTPELDGQTWTQFPQPKVKPAA